MIRLRPWVVFLASLVVGGTFVVAGSLKSLDVEGFARDIALHRIIGTSLSAIAARMLVPFEIAVGVAAIVGYRRRLALALLIATLAVFIAGTGWAWAHGNTEGCGCFGRFASRTPLSVIVEDLLLIGGAALAFFMDEARSRGTPPPRIAPSPNPSIAQPLRPGDVNIPRSGEGPRDDGAHSAAPARERASVDAAGQQSATAGVSATEPFVGASAGEAHFPASKHPGPRLWRPILVWGVAVLSIVFAIASPSLPLDTLATALRPGVHIHALGLDAIAGNLAEGDRLLVILVLDETASQGSVSPLNALAGAPGVPRLTGLTSATEQARSEFFFAYAPAFEILEVPSADLRRLYRRAPRAFRVHNGRVLQVWDGVPPAEDLAK